MNRLKRTAFRRGQNLVRKLQFILSAFTLVGVMSAVLARTDGDGRPTKSQDQERIGIYDSRAVAIAYAGSAFQKEKMKALTNQLEEAKKAGDANAMARLKAEGRAWQTTLHQQGFGTAPVDDLLNHLSSQMPRIQKDAGVIALISKWNKTELDKHPGADRIDVTMALVDAFGPSAVQRQRAIEIQQKPPVKVQE